MDRASNVYRLVYIYEYIKDTCKFWSDADVISFSKIE